MEIPTTPAQLGSAFEKFPDWREGQVETLEKILASNKRFLLLDAPTGSGKSIINTSLHKLLEKYYTIYGTSSKKLQDQYIKDFGDFAVEIKGKGNYPCLLGLDDASQCIDKKEDPCKYKAECPYYLQVEEARFAEMAVPNTWSLLYQANFAQRFIKDSWREDEPHRSLLILDEADTLEAVLISFAERTISRRQCREYHIPPPNFHEEDISYWRTWIEISLDILDHTYRMTKDEKDKARLEAIIKSWKFLGNNLSDTWIAEGEEDIVKFTPIDVSGLAWKHLFNYYDRILFSSASFCGPNMFTGYMGIDEEDYDYFYVPSTFPIQKRPIYYCPVGSMGNKLKEETFPKIANVIDMLLYMFPNEQVVIHTNSTSNAEDLSKMSKHQISTYISGQETLDAFMSKRIRILAGPSLDRGYDFKDDLCRINIIMKVPFPYLGDKSIMARMKYPKWYEWQSIQKIVQATGRSTRSADDYSLTFILDSDFMRLFNGTTKKLFPKWWVDAYRGPGQISYKLLEDAENA